MTGSPTTDELWRNVVNVLNGSRGNDKLEGFGGADMLLGGMDNDTLKGGDGDDTLMANTARTSSTADIGNDTYYVDNAGDAVPKPPTAARTSCALL